MQWSTLLQHLAILLVSSVLVFSKTTIGVSSFYRNFEGFVGGKILDFANRQFLKQADLVKKEVFLPDMGLTVHYYERKGSTQTQTEDEDDNESAEGSQPPTLLLFHGITDEAKNFGGMAAKLAKELPHWRIVVPDMIGHGHDLERAKREGPDFEYPTPTRLLQSTKEFLNVMQIEDCVAFGISMGGALVYFLQQQQPALVKSSILISPALDAVLDPKFVNDFQARHKNHFCYESRDDIKYFFRDLSSPNRKTKDPIPTFFLEAVWQDRLAREPEGHFRSIFQTFLDSRGKDPNWLGCDSDIDPEAKRLVIWPQDDYIANHDQGRAFFANSSRTGGRTTFQSLPDCGHLFHANGGTVMDHATPKIISFLKEHEKERPIRRA